MEFSITCQDRALSDVEVRLEEHADDSTAVIIETCQAMAEANAIVFRVSAFGQKNWPVDVRTDLPVLLEQLPDAISALRESADEFTLDFYEQGLERRMTFYRINGGFRVVCSSSTDWIPEPSEVVVEFLEVSRQLAAIRDSFLDAVARISPTLRADWRVVEWARLAGAAR